MKHCSEEDLILHYYGEAPGGEAVSVHLTTCAQCDAAFQALRRDLEVVPIAEVPERGPQYGLEVWQRIRTQLPEPESSWRTMWDGWNRFALAGLGSALLIAGFFAGRSWPHGPQLEGVSRPAPVQPASARTGEARRRILLTAVADHLDRSDRILTEIMNAPEGGDISATQRWADDLLATSRLYRQDAAEAGERSVAAVLDEIERALIEIVHSPARATDADLELMRRRIDAASLLFKVRVMGEELQERSMPPAPSIRGRSSRSPSQTS